MRYEAQDFHAESRNHRRAIELLDEDLSASGAVRLKCAPCRFDIVKALLKVVER
jgi:hypothetical protein